MSGGPYRSRAELARDVAPAEMLYVASEREGGLPVLREILRAILLAFLLGAWPATMGYPLVVVPLFALALLWAWWRRPKDVAGVMLRVDHGRLEVLSRRTRQPLFGVSLSELEDVMMDTKSISKLLYGRTLIPALVLVDTKVAPPIDVTRIALVPGEDTPVFYLTDERVPYQDGVRGIADVRRFLRSHGWVPADERA